jgi:hypothetical protein
MTLFFNPLNGLIPFQRESSPYAIVGLMSRVLLGLIGLSLAPTFPDPRDAGS